MPIRQIEHIMSAISIPSVPVKMAGFPVYKKAEPAFESNYSAKLKEWLQCQDFILAAKAHSNGSLPVNADSLRHVGAIEQFAYSRPYVQGLEMPDDMISVFVAIFNDGETLESEAQEMAKKIKPASEQLREVSIHDKREVIRYMQIIPTAIAAAYIGVSEHALNEWNNRRKVFGANYAGGHCYSLEELKMISNNRDWIYNTVDSDDFRITAPDDEKSMDEVVMVDNTVASAFTDLSNVELYQQLPRNQLTKRPYRLSDLEKIRVAKLNGQQH